jgi:hypothetical protein
LNTILIHIAIKASAKVTIVLLHPAVNTMQGKNGGIASANAIPVLITAFDPPRSQLLPICHYSLLPAPVPNTVVNCGVFHRKTKNTIMNLLTIN